MAWSHFDTLAGGRSDVMFNQGMTLLRTADGLRLARFPVKELETLRAGKATRQADFDGELAARRNRSAP